MLRNYFKVGFRSLLKNRVFSMINILGLAVGLAGFSLIWTYVSFELSYDKFHNDSHNIYRVTTDQIVENVIRTRDAMSFSPEGRALFDEYPEVINFTTTRKQFGNFTMRIGDQLFAEKMVLAVDTNFLDMFNYPIIEGDSENPLRDPHSMVLTRSVARKLFGDESPIGKSVHVYVNFNTPFRVTGVVEDTPENTHYKFDMLISFESITESANQDGWNGFNYYTYIKVREGTNMDALRARMPEISRKYLSDETTLFFNLQSLESIHLYSNFTFEPEVHGSARTIYFLGIISVFIIIIAWVNYINLSTAKAMDRAKEVGMRKVVGAQKLHLIKQFLIESMLINIISAIIALTIIQLVKPAFNELIGKEVILSAWLNVDLLTTMLLLFFLGTFLSGFYPALVLSSFQPVSVLKGKLRTSNKGIALRKGLVIFQFTTSLALIAGTVIVYLQINFMRNQDIGVDIDRVFAITEPYRYGNGPEGYGETIETFHNQLAQLSSVLNVASTSTVPGSGSSDISSFSAGLRLDGEAESDRSTYYAVWMDEKYIDAIGLKLLAGRNFVRGMASDSSAIIINETVLKRLGFNQPEDAINHYVQMGTDPENERLNIIGVVNNANRQTLKNDFEPTLFFFNERSTAGNQVVKIAGADIRSTMAEIESIWFNLLPNAPFEYMFLDDKFDIAYKEDQRFGSVFGIFAILAILIACLGLFACRHSLRCSEPKK